MTIRCAVVGATGLAGQQFLAALLEHPFIEVGRLAASERSAGKTLKEAVTLSSGLVGWYVDERALARYGQMRVEDAKQLQIGDVDVIFSAVESEPARELEPMYAESLPVISAASAFRYDDDVPLIIPAVNGHHAELIRFQREQRRWKGYIVPIPNCTTTGMAITLAPLFRDFGVEKVMMTSLQAVSGAGRSPGVIGLDIIDNVIPHIKGEEEKVEKETKKILGKLGHNAIEAANVMVSCTCTRVSVLEGHTETVAASFSKAARLDEVRASLVAFGKDINPGTHPSAPKNWITVLDDPYRPQPRRDRDSEDGMTTSVGRLREERVLGPHGVKLVLVSHNTKMGAAKGAILVAEDLKLRGFL